MWRGKPAATSFSAASSRTASQAAATFLHPGAAGKLDCVTDKKLPGQRKVRRTSAKNEYIHEKKQGYAQGGLLGQRASNENKEVRWEKIEQPKRC
jgi:hypothetical protein